MKYFTVELNLFYVSDLMKFLFSCYNENVYALFCGTWEYVKTLREKSLSLSRRAYKKVLFLYVVKSITDFSLQIFYSKKGFL